ncbi:MAG TPA: hypothetical protein VMY34_02300 [Acidimicrobiales bacterium]|nr:hypothetical protein [Acidimicrobiales bacterium]
MRTHRRILAAVLLATAAGSTAWVAPAANAEPCDQAPCGDTGETVICIAAAAPSWKAVVAAITACSLRP